MGRYDELSWKRGEPEHTDELAEIIRANPELFHPDLRIDPPTTIERYSNPTYRFESYGLRAGANPAILVRFSDIIDWENGRANAIEYTLVESAVLQPGETVLEFIRKRKSQSWLPKLRYWFLIESSKGRTSAHHGIRGALKELIGRELPPGNSETKQWSQLFEKYGVGEPGFEFIPYGSIAVLGSIFLARSRYAEIPLEDIFNFGPR